jgi:hypothetical protein
MAEIWQKCVGNNYIKPIEVKAWRIVESQYQIATRRLVDNLREHRILEELIESHKPLLPEYCQGYHYLLATPFRYPPLDYGSRFGTRYEPGLWYGSLAIQTALAEKAYYRFRFLAASETHYEEVPIKYSAFLTEIKTSQALDLTELPFSNYTHEISKRDTYLASQQLGKQMRQTKVAAFYYSSARCPHKGKNIGLFLPCAFKNKTPMEPFQTWQGTVINAKSKMEFIRTNCLHDENCVFAVDIFLINGKLPCPN